jgi:dolichyl-phosphate beta-glucosyltransferase
VSDPHLSVIVPAYNEAQRIESTVAAIRSYLDARGTTFEIIVAADGTDGTREKVAEMAKSDPRLSVLGSPQRSGKGRGIRLGVERARGEIIGFCDADYKTGIEEVEKLLPHLKQGYDIAIGSRAVAGARIEVPQPWYRRIGSKAFAVCMHTVIGLWSIHDTQCGFKFFRGEVAKDLFSRQRIDGYMFDVEILYLAGKSGYRIKEVGVNWRDDGDSRLDLVSGNWKNMKEILRIRFGRHAPRPAAREEKVTA